MYATTCTHTNSPTKISLVLQLLEACLFGSESSGALGPGAVIVIVFVAASSVVNVTPRLARKNPTKENWLIFRKTSFTVSQFTSHYGCQY